MKASRAIGEILFLLWKENAGGNGVISLISGAWGKERGEQAGKPEKKHLKNKRGHVDGQTNRNKREENWCGRTERKSSEGKA